MVIILRRPPHFPSHIVPYQTVIPTSDLYSFVSPAPHCCIVIQFQCFGGLCCVISNCLWQKFTRTSSSLWWITSVFVPLMAPHFWKLFKKKQYLWHIYLVQIIKLQVTSARQPEFKLIMKRQHWQTQLQRGLTVWQPDWNFWLKLGDFIESPYLLPHFCRCICVKPPSGTFLSSLSQTKQEQGSPGFSLPDRNLQHHQPSTQRPLTH